MKRSFWYIAVIVAAVGCSGGHSLDTLFSESVPAPPCIVEKQQVKVDLGDYFPSLKGNDSISIVMGKSEPFLDVKEITSRKKSAALVIENCTEAKRRSFGETQAPFISTNAIRGTDEAFYVDIDNGADIIYVLWQNTLMKKDVKTMDPTRIRITVPRNASRSDLSVIRVFAANQNGMSNDLAIPLRKGHVISDISDIDASISERISPYQRRTVRFPGHNFALQDSLERLFAIDSIRRQSTPMALGDFYPLYESDEVLAYMHNYMGRQAIVFINSSGQDTDVRVNLPLGLIYKGANEILRTVGPHSYLILD